MGDKAKDRRGKVQWNLFLSSIMSGVTKSHDFVDSVHELQLKHGKNYVSLVFLALDDNKSSQVESTKNVLDTTDGE